MLTADDFRRIAVGMKDVLEGAHMGHPDFRVNGKIFATIHPDHACGMVKLTPEQQQEFVKTHPPRLLLRMAHGDVRAARACDWIRWMKRRSAKR